MKRKKTVALLLSALIAVGTLSACGSKPSSSATPNTSVTDASKPETVYTLKIGIANSLSDAEEPETIFINTFQSELDRLTNGAVVLDVYPNSQLGSMEEMRDMVVSGTLEGILCNINTITPLYPNAMALVCPGIFADEAEINEVLRSEWGKKFFREMADATNLYVAGVCSNGMRCYTSNEGPLTTVDTIKGQTIRVMQNPMCVAMAESIGVNAVPMAGSEMYSAMQSNVVDGQENPINSIINDKTYEVQKYLVLDKHMPSILTFVLSDSFYKGLPAEYQSAVESAVLTASEALAVAIDRVNVDGVAYLKEAGIEVYEPTADELKAWQDPVYEACSAYLQKEIGTETLDSLSAAVRQYRVAG